MTGEAADPTALVPRFSPVSNDQRRQVAPDRELNVLLATDILSEGQNLQDCSIVVNYDLPWAIIRFFDAYSWHLDERPLRNDNEINPDVLGYIFEKYVNQKQMGAYYTKEDITGYIARNTLLPFLLDETRKQCAIAFAADGSVWKLLRDDPNRYIYAEVRQGVGLPLPQDIAAGLDDVNRREGWNRPAVEDFALPTETWREHVARRCRCLELRRRLGNGEVTSVNDLVTLNLDIRQFVEDLIESCEGVELLRAVYRALTRVSVLDPTCGSGAFLFAALNLLEPLYDACLERMQGFIDDAERVHGAAGRDRFSDFREILAQVDVHPNRRYFILKSIIQPLRRGHHGRSG